MNIFFKNQQRPYMTSNLLVIMQEFARYVDIFAKAFDDNIFIIYENIEDRPCFKILVYPTIDIRLVKQHMPNSWIELARTRKISIELRYAKSDDLDCLKEDSGIVMSKKTFSDLLDKK